MHACWMCFSLNFFVFHDDFCGNQNVWNLELIISLLSEIMLHHLFICCSMKYCSIED